MLVVSQRDGLARFLVELVGPVRHTLCVRGSNDFVDDIKMDQEQKIDDMHGMIHEMKPMLADVKAGLMSQDLRLGFLEKQNIRNDMRIDRHDTDLSRMGTNIREVEGRVKSLEDKRHIREAAGVREGHKRTWIALLEFLASAPQYLTIWHWVASGVVVVVTIAGLILRQVHMGVHR